MTQVFELQTWETEMKGGLKWFGIGIVGIFVIQMLIPANGASAQPLPAMDPLVKAAILNALINFCRAEFIQPWLY